MAGWKDSSPTLSILNLELIVLSVMARKADAWIVTSSHGDPGAKNEFPSKETAQRWAEKFAATQIERTLAALGEIENTLESPSNGWKAVPCGILVLSIEPSKDFLDDNGGVRPDVFEQQRQALIDSSRRQLHEILQGFNR